MIANTPEAWSQRAKLPTSWNAAMWSAEGQKSRFCNVIDALEPRQGETLLDYGCGTGSFSEQIPPGVQYLGHDWSVGMLARAERDHPYRDFTKYEPNQPFDMVACIGPFNLADNWSKLDTWEKLHDLWIITKRALAVCLYAGDDPANLCYDEVEAARFGVEHSNDYEVTRHLPNDILLVLRK